MAKKTSVHTYPLSTISKEFSSIMNEMLTEYADTFQKNSYRAVQKIANTFAEDLKSVTPRSDSVAGYDGAHLADSIVVSKKGERYYSSTHEAYFVHFQKWQIAHLLEFGWTARNGRRIERTPFVRPLFDNNKERYMQIIKEELSK